MKKLLLSNLLLLSAFFCAQGNYYLSPSSGLLLNKEKKDNLNFELSIGKKMGAKTFLEGNIVYADLGVMNLNSYNLAFGLENKLKESKLGYSAFIGSGLSALKDNNTTSYFNFQIGATFDYIISENSSFGFKLSNNFNQGMQFTLTNLFYKFKF